MKKYFCSKKPAHFALNFLMLLLLLSGFFLLGFYISFLGVLTSANDNLRKLSYLCYNHIKLDSSSSSKYVSRVCRSGLFSGRCILFCVNKKRFIDHKRDLSLVVPLVCKQFIHSLSHCFVVTNTQLSEYAPLAEK